MIFVPSRVLMEDRFCSSEEYIKKKMKNLDNFQALRYKTIQYGS